MYYNVHEKSERNSSSEPEAERVRGWRGVFDWLFDKLRLSGQTDRGGKGVGSGRALGGGAGRPACRSIRDRCFRPLFSTAVFDRCV